MVYLYFTFTLLILDAFLGRYLSREARPDIQSHRRKPTLSSTVRRRCQDLCVRFDPTKYGRWYLPASTIPPRLQQFNFSYAVLNGLARLSQYIYLVTVSPQSRPRLKHVVERQGLPAPASPFRTVVLQFSMPSLENRGLQLPSRCFLPGIVPRFQFVVENQSPYFCVPKPRPKIRRSTGTPSDPYFFY